MAAVGGSIQEVYLNGRAFSVAADADSNRKIGGLENEVKANGDGSARYIKTRVPWSADGLTLSVDDNRGDHEYLQSLADQPDPFPITATYASGVTYQGTGTIVGEMTFSSQNATVSLGLAGEGKFTKQ